LRISSTALCVCARVYYCSTYTNLFAWVRGLFLWESSLTVAFQACGVLRPSRMHQRLSGVDPTLGRFPRRSLLLFRSRGRASTTSGFCQVASARPGDPGGGPGAVRPTVKVTVTSLSLAHGHKVFDFFAISSLISLLHNGGEEGWQAREDVERAAAGLPQHLLCRGCCTCFSTQKPISGERWNASNKPHGDAKSSSR
jgi:hypothetical protein